MENTYSIMDIYLKTNNVIILLSGLDMSPLNQVTKELCEAFNGIVLDYTHLDLDSDLKVINDRVIDLTKNSGNVLFIKGKSFDKQHIKFRVDLHLNISINNKMINDDILSSKYKTKLTSNYINKYYNYKEETDINDYIDNIFLHIIDDIEKKLYKDKYSKLNHKVYVEGQEQETEIESEYVAQPSKLMSNPEALSLEQKNDIAIKEMEEEFDESSPDTSDSDEEFMADSVLFESH